MSLPENLFNKSARKAEQKAEQLKQRKRSKQARQRPDNRRKQAKTEYSGFDTQGCRLGDPEDLTNLWVWI